MLCDITVAPSANVTHVVLAGEIDLSNRETIAATLHSCVTDPAVTAIEVDLTGVSFIDASGIGALITSWHHAQRRGKTLRTTGARGRVATVLELVGVAQLLNGE